MEKKLSMILIVICLLALALSVCAYLGLFSPAEVPGLTVVTAPEQLEAQRPACFPDPTANYISLPTTKNLAEGRPISSGEHNDVYVITNVNDGKTDTYWESKGFPAEMVIDLGGTHSISTVAVLLNPSTVWEGRTQELALWVSQDGQNFTELVGAAKYDFDPNTGNRIRIDFASVEAAYVKLVFTMNSSSRTGGAQAAEVQVYE